MINRFGKNIFTENYKLTIGVDFEVQDFNILGHSFKLNVTLIFSCKILELRF